MDATRLLGALLGGVLTPPRPRRTTAKRTTKQSAKRAAKPAPLIDVRVGGSRRTASALTALARLAAEALAQTSAPSPRAPAPPAPAPRPTPPGVPVPYPVSGRSSPWGTAKPAAPPPPAPEPVGAEEREALLIIRAMIAAARADGAIDAEERAAIAGQLDQAGLDGEARELVLKEFASPASLDALAREIADPVLAAQVYAACVIAVGQASDAERAWLAELARRTGLAAETVAAIERRLAAG
jgi:uncharacterized membrane protein YebE (DUF533 family)